MPLQLSSLPISPPYDPVADAAGSADPLGTLGGSERLADVILPGLTARMWRARLLTFAVVSADIADAVVRKRADQEELRLPARLALERMFVASLVRCEEKDPSKYSGVSRRVPGSLTARRAFRTDDEPLTRQNFIKGQAVNGPSGVMARLARNLNLLNDAGQIANQGHDLRSCWARQAAADEETGADVGSDFDRRALDAVLLHVEKDAWPNRNAPIWQLLADALRPDRIPAAERKILFQFLNAEPQYGIRPRVLQLLLHEKCQAVYRHTEDAEKRGQIERPVLLKGMMPLLGTGTVDAHINIAIRTIDVYEQFSELFGAAFDFVLSELLASGGSAPQEQLLKKAKLNTIFKQLSARLVQVVPLIRGLLPMLVSGVFVDQRIPELMTEVLKDAECGAASVGGLFESVLSRHERVQRDKRKLTWVDRSSSLTLMPGTPVSDELWHNQPAAFIHPYRVVNAYSLMLDLKLLKGGRASGQDERE